MAKILVMARGSYMGGVEKSLMQFLKFLVKEKHEVDLYLWTLPGVLFSEIPSKVNILSSGKFPQSIKECNLKNFIPFVVYRISTLRSGSYKLWSRVIGRLIPTRYDIAISFSDNDYSRYCVIDNIEAEKKIQFYHHGCYSSDGKVAVQDAKYFSAYDNIVTVSAANREMLLKHFPELKEKIRVINNLIDIDEISQKANDMPTDLKEELSNHSCALKLCTVGRLSKDKGTDIAFEIAGELMKRGVDFRWFFVGEEIDKGMIDLFKSDKDIYERCVFPGVCKNPYAYLNACDIYIHPSRIESECLVVKEASLLNKKMVVSDIPSMRDFVSGVSSCSVSEPTGKAFADAIIKLKDAPAPTSNAAIIRARNKDAQTRIRSLLEV